MNDNKSRDIFYGVVAIATLIVAIVGATLAYFSITAGSNEGAVSAKAATVSISYDDGQEVLAQADKLIPADLAVVQAVYERNTEAINEQIGEGKITVDEQGVSNKSNVCIDDEDQEVCSIYRFSVRSDDTRNIIATLKSEYNGFTDLAYAVRKVNCTDDGTNNCWMVMEDQENTKYQKLTRCVNTDERTAAEAEDEDLKNCSTTANNIKTYDLAAKNSIFGLAGAGVEASYVTQEIGDAKTSYDLVLFILNKPEQNQNYDQGKEFRGTIVVELSGNNGEERISGKIH